MEGLLKVLRDIQDEVFRSGAHVICDVTTHWIDDANYSLKIGVTSFTARCAVDERAEFEWTSWWGWTDEALAEFGEFKKQLAAMLEGER